MVIKQDKVPFEDALRMAGFGKYNVLAFVLCSSVIMGMVFEIFSVSYLVPASACELGTTSAHQGLMAAMPLMGVILTSHVWGYMADLKGRRLILLTCMSLGYLSASLAAFSPNWIVLSVLKLCSSASVSGAYALALTLMSECTLMEKRSILVMLTTSVFLVFSGVMAVLSIPILSLKFSFYVPYLDIHFNAWRLLDLIFALPSAIGALGMYCSYESPKYLLGIGRHEEALDVLKGMFQINSGKSRDLYRVNSIVLDEERMADVVGFWASMKAQTLPLLRQPLLKDTVLLSLLTFIVYVSVNPYQVWLPFIADATMHALEAGHANLTLCQMVRLARDMSSTRDQAGDCSMNQFGMMIVFSISLVIAASNLVASVAMQYCGRKTFFIALEVIGGVAVIYINLSYNWIVSAVCFMIFLAGIINFTTLASYCVELYPTYVKAMAVCVTLMIGRGSAIISINMVKKLLDDNCEAGFYIFGAVYIVGGVVGLLLPTDRQIAKRKEDLKLRATNTT